MMDPNIAYRKDFLWLPKAHVNNLDGVRHSLTFPLDQGASSIQAWSETDNHIVVPREYIPYEDYQTLPFPVEDICPDIFPPLKVKTTFPLRDAVQHLSHDRLCEKGSGVLSLSCGKGKTVIALHAWATVGIPALVVVPTKDLAYQWKDRIVEHTDTKEDEIGWIQGSKWDWEKPISIGLVQTLASRAEKIPEEMRRHLGIIIYDEVHRLGAPYFNKTAAIGYGIRWGLSATPFRKDGLDALYRYHTGDVIYQNLEHDNIPEVFFQKTGTTLTTAEFSSLRDRFGDLSMPRLYTHLSKQDGRNEVVLSMLKDAALDGRVTLALSERVDHIKYLHCSLKEWAKDKGKKWDSLDGSPCGLIHGDVKGEERQAILNGYPIVLATPQIARDGLDRKDLNTVFILMPFTDRGRFQQIIGRSQRAKDPIIVVFEDDISPCKRMCDKLRAHLTELKYPFYSAPEVA